LAYDPADQSESAQKKGKKVMMDLPHPWDAYLRIQEKLSSKTRVDNKAWGYEAALNRILAFNSASPSLEPDEIERTIASAERRDRYNKAQLRMMSSEMDCSAQTAVVGPAQAREELKLIKISISSDDWALLLLVGMGHDYSCIAALRNSTTGELRTRVLRLRRSLKRWHE
jgi:hypothetical protein